MTGGTSNLSQRGDQLFLTATDHALIANIASFPMRTHTSDVVCHTIITTHLVELVAWYTAYSGASYTGGVSRKNRKNSDRTT